MNIKNDELCTKCAFDYDRNCHRPCEGCEMAIENEPCRCLTIRDGEECPYFKSAEATDNAEVCDFCANGEHLHMYDKYGNPIIPRYCPSCGKEVS